MSSRLDGLRARLVAAAIAALCLGLLGYLHRGDLFSGSQDPGATDAPYVNCLAEREADIDGMVRDGRIAESQAVLFKRRAAGLCRAIVDGKTTAR